MHALAIAHETPTRPWAVAPNGLKLVWIAHGVPFHCSASVKLVPSPLGYRAEPIPKHMLWDGHDTPTRSVWDAADGLGETCMSQLEPSQRSAIGWLNPLCPTAVHAVGVVHETALRKSSVVPGLGSIVHVAPSLYAQSLAPTPDIRQLR